MNNTIKYIDELKQVDIYCSIENIVEFDEKLKSDLEQFNNANSSPTKTGYGPAARKENENYNIYKINIEITIQNIFIIFVNFKKAAENKLSINYYIYRVQIKWNRN